MSTLTLAVLAAYGVIRCTGMFLDIVRMGL
jgi:hypothetical protein